MTVFRTLSFRTFFTSSIRENMAGIILFVVTLVGLATCVVGDGEVVENDLLYNWRPNRLLKLGLPDGSFKEDFFEESNGVEYVDDEEEEEDTKDFGPPLTPDDFEAGQKLPEKYFSPGEGHDPIQKSGHFEGDINNPRFIEGRNAIRDNNMKWPRGEIPYVVANMFDPQQRSIIARAMEEFHKQTCIRFVPRTHHQDYVFITRKVGCFSMIGRDGGQQLLSLGEDCVYVGIVVHEFMHAVGFWHEQSRADRDDYVNILWDNIQQGQTHNFAKYTDGRLHHLGESYDYDSIMHYGSYDFTRFRGRPTILPKRQGVFIGQRNGFSRTDVRKINKLYQCSTNTRDTCVDNDSQCRGWAELGECKKNPKWMNANCRRACNMCNRRLLDAFDRNQTMST